MLDLKGNSFGRNSGFIVIAAIPLGRGLGRHCTVKSGLNEAKGFNYVAHVLWN